MQDTSQCKAPDISLMHAGWTAARMGEPLDETQPADWQTGHATYKSMLLTKQLGRLAMRTAKRSAALHLRRSESRV
jgi:hypothetical protein